MTDDIAKPVIIGQPQQPATDIAALVHDIPPPAMVTPPAIERISQGTEERKLGYYIGEAKLARKQHRKQIRIGPFKRHWKGCPYCGSTNVNENGWCYKHYPEWLEYNRKENEALKARLIVDMNKKVKIHE